MRRWIMHVDMDAFYASVEQLDTPEYRGKPVIVGGLSSRGVVSTASYEARAFGVHSAMPMSVARRKCPEGIFVWPRFERYQEISSRIREIMERFTPYIEPLSLDEAFMDVTGMGELYKGPLALGKAIKDQVLTETGLIISAGVAPNKFLAKLASDLEKPDGLVVIPYGKEEEILKPLPIRRLWGVGKETEKHLLEAGFQTIGDIAAVEDYHALIPFFGNQSQRLYELSHGIDNRPVEYERQVKSIGNEETYEDDVRDSELIDREWRYFAYRVAKRLRRAGLMGHTVSVKVRFPDFTTRSRQKSFIEPTNNEILLYETAQSLYNSLHVRTPVRLLGLTVSGLTEAVKQPSLFEEESPLEEILDDLESKFGHAVVQKGSLWQRGREK